jgi:cyanophycinase
MNKVQQDSADTRGAFIAIGGHEDKSGDMAVLKRVLTEAKGSESRVHVITTAGTLPEEYKKMYEDAFRLLGIECVVTYISTRAEANDPAIVSRISDADVVFFSGGDQLRLTTILGGTAVMDKVMELHDKGAVVAGTSAGAAAASSLMIYARGHKTGLKQTVSEAFGIISRRFSKSAAQTSDSPAQAMEKGNILLTTGFGFIPGVVVDTHFGKRRRLSWLFNVVASNPDNLGIGLDENTAIIKRGQNIEVVGSGSVTVIDGSGISHSNIADIGKGEKIIVDGIKTSKLVSGQVYDLKERKVII